MCRISPSYPPRPLPLTSRPSRQFPVGKSRTVNSRQVPKHWVCGSVLRKSHGAAGPPFFSIYDYGLPSAKDSRIGGIDDFDCKTARPQDCTTLNSTLYALVSLITDYRLPPELVAHFAPECWLSLVQNNHRGARAKPETARSSACFEAPIRLV